MPPAPTFWPAVSPRICHPSSCSLCTPCHRPEVCHALALVWLLSHGIGSHDYLVSSGSRCGAHHPVEHPDMHTSTSGVHCKTIPRSTRMADGLIDCSLLLRHAQLQASKLLLPAGEYHNRPHRVFPTSLLTGMYFTVRCTAAWSKSLLSLSDLPTGLPAWSVSSSQSSNTRPSKMLLTGMDA